MRAWRQRASPCRGLTRATGSTQPPSRTEVRYVISQERSSFRLLFWWYQENCPQISQWAQGSTNLVNRNPFAFGKTIGRMVTLRCSPGRQGLHRKIKAQEHEHTGFGVSREHRAKRAPATFVPAQPATLGSLGLSKGHLPLRVRTHGRNFCSLKRRKWRNSHYGQRWNTFLLTN